MNKYEHLLSPEGSIETPEHSALQNPDQQAKFEVEMLFEQRFFSLEHLKTDISLSFYYAVHEKISREKQKLVEILHLEDAKEKYLKKYSFILDPAYFDQQFLIPS